ncbi:MAG: Flp pilus assembly complex ATPase component TadA [Candidatus Riflebacteria bacterium]|nr:Flp pilus assembly complex ATPase component TadA [Candidatus Riflebacteria bacterium]
MTTSQKKARTFVVTSFQGGIGKTFVAAALASALHKKTGKPVALIEFNLMRPSTILDQLGDSVQVKNSFLEYYMGNWASLSASNLANHFTTHQGVYYIPFCGNRPGETLQPRFHLSEGELSDSLRHLIGLFEELEGYVVIDILFQLSPLPTFLLSRADALLYVYTSQPPSPAFALKFRDEASCRNGLAEKILWVRNHAEDLLESSESRLFEQECPVPLSGELAMEAAEDKLEQSIDNLLKHALIMPGAGIVPGEELSIVSSIPVEIADYQKTLRTEVVGELDKSFGISDHELREKVEAKIDDAMRRTPPPKVRGHNAEAEVKRFLVDEILGLGPLEEFMRDEEVDEIMVNGPDRVFVEKGGRLILTDRKFNSSDHVRTVIERILMQIGRTINERTPYVDARLLDGSRVHAIIPPLALTGPMITIRKFSKIPISMEDLIYRFNSLSIAAAEFLKLCVHLKKNIIVSGGASSGKTTLLNVLSNFILPSERVICIEDSAELKLTQVNLGRLEARQQGTEAKTQVTIRDLVRNALRMRPDRIIVGECRGAEAIDMLQAMNTGHDGSLTTLHANTPRDALARLETMVLMAGVDLPLRAIREQIASSVNFVVQNGRLADGSRRLLELVEVIGIEDNIIKTQTIFKFEKKWIGEDGHVAGELLPTGALPEFIKSIPGNFLEQHAHLFKMKSPAAKIEEASS